MDAVPNTETTPGNDQEEIDEDLFDEYVEKFDAGREERLKQMQKEHDMWWERFSKGKMSFI